MQMSINFTYYDNVLPILNNMGVSAGIYLKDKHGVSKRFLAGFAHHG